MLTDFNRICLSIPLLLINCHVEGTSIDPFCNLLRPGGYCMAEHLGMLFFAVW